MSSTTPPVNSASERQAWIDRVENLLSQVRGWAEEEGWLVTVAEKQITERVLGDYVVGELFMKTPQGHLVLEPVARSVSGADGRVDLYAWPSLNRVILIRRQDRWVVRTDSGVNWPRPWGRDCFVELARGLTAAAA